MATPQPHIGDPMSSEVGDEAQQNEDQQVKEEDLELEEDAATEIEPPTQN